MKKISIFLAAAVCILFSCATGRTVTPLHEAVRDGLTEDAESLIANGASVNARDEEGRTALHYCAGNGDVALLNLLLSGGADPNLPDDNGKTPLHYAAENCYAEIIELLLAAGADPSAVDADGQTAGDAAGCPDVKNMLQ